VFVLVGLDSPLARLIEGNYQAKHLASTIEAMKNAALELPGGGLSTMRIEELNGVLDQEAEKRRCVVRHDREDTA
jgi:hypothetical protein